VPTVASPTKPDQQIKNNDELILFNTTFLKDSDRVRSFLKTKGFSKGYFTTTDNIKIRYLLCQREHATCTVIACSGFLPGKKEGLATLYGILPPSCNLLLFDARGHGESGGTFLGSCLTYGKHEYKDIIAAIEFAYHHTQLPNIIFGMCSGAFHAAHALIQLKKDGALHDKKVAGLIFDSGWGSLKETSRSTAKAKVRDVLLSFCSYFAKKTSIKNHYVWKALSAKADMVWNAFHNLFVAPHINEKETNLFDKISEIPTPIFYIHAMSDDYVSIDNVQSLARLSQCPQSWWIEQPSKHALNHLKHKEAYAQKIASFIAHIVPSKI